MDENSGHARGAKAEIPRDPDLRGFQTKTTWTGEEVLTLADIPPSEGAIVLIGINPSPISIVISHYYRGTLGKRLWSRLASWGILPSKGAAWEDERWQAAGNGLSDMVKRPAASATEVFSTELFAVAEVLRSKLRDWKPGLIVFPFRASAEAVLDFAPPAGRGPDVDGVPTFRMEGPLRGGGQGRAERLGFRSAGGGSWRARAHDHAAASLETFSGPARELIHRCGAVSAGNSGRPDRRSNPVPALREAALPRGSFDRERLPARVGDTGPLRPASRPGPRTVGGPERGPTGARRHRRVRAPMRHGPPCRRPRVP